MILNLALLLPLQVLAGPQGPQFASPACPPGLEDQSQPGTCINAASIPTPGMLLPLGPYFWVGGSGEVGVGTQQPQAKLHVAGDILGEGRLAIGSEAVLGGSGAWTYEADMGFYVDQFPGTFGIGLHSEVRYDPPIDLTGPDTGWLWAHMFETSSVASNDRDIDALFGLVSHALPRGSGVVTYVLGSGGVAENDTGHVIDQSGGAFTSVGDNDSTIGLNTWLYASGGHHGTGGSIQTDYGVYVESPWASSPLMNHYGLYLADQDFGENDSYAIYAAGGMNYLADSLGVGVTTPTVKLDVAGDFAATGTKSFRQSDPQDPSREVWFVCLEGNEAGTYFRGTGQLVNGQIEIPVPEDFAIVTEEEGLTVQVTALGDARLWIERKSLNSILVKGTGDVEFDYLVNGVRAGYAGFETIRQKPLEPVAAQAGRTRPFPTRPPEEN